MIILPRQARDKHNNKGRLSQKRDALSYSGRISTQAPAPARCSICSRSRQLPAARAAPTTATPPSSAGQQQIPQPGAPECCLPHRAATSWQWPRARTAATFWQPGGQTPRRPSPLPTARPVRSGSWALLCHPGLRIRHCFSRPGVHIII
jgi:hypothetical protein